MHKAQINGQIKSLPHYGCISGPLGSPQISNKCLLGTYYPEASDADVAFDTMWQSRAQAPIRKHPENAAADTVSLGKRDAVICEE